MFYRIDKLGLESSQRLSGIYQSASDYNGTFPILEDATGYELYDQSLLSPGKKVYNAGATC